MGAVTVRRAEQRDIPWLVAEFKEFDRFYASGRSLIQPDEDKLRVHLGSVIENHPQFLFLVGEQDERLLGFILGIKHQHFFNPEIVVLSELLWWVSLPARGTFVGARLLHTYVEWGKQNSDWLVMTLEAKSPVNPESLERRGFVLHERNYLLEVER